MKKFLLGAAFAVTASAAMAGSYADPVIDDAIIIEQAATSSVNHAIIAPLMFVIMVGASMIMIP